MLKRIRSYLKLLFLSLKFIISSARWEGIIVLVFLSFGGVLSVAVLALTRLLVNDLSMLSSQGMNTKLTVTMVLLVLVFAVQGLITPWIAYFQGNLNEKLTAELLLSLMNKVGAIEDLSPYENPKFHDDLEILKTQAMYRPLNLLIFLSNALRNLVAAIGTLALLFSVSAIYPLLVVIATVPQAFLNFKLENDVWETMISATPFVRRMKYYSNILLEAETAKEIRLFRLLDFFRSRFQSTFKQHYGKLRPARARKALGITALVSLSIFAVALVLFLGLKQTVSGAISIGSMVLLLQSLIVLQNDISFLISDTGLLYENLLYFERLDKFLKMPSILKEVDNPKTITNFEEIVFDNLSFNYPDGREVLKNISFSIKRGERFAIVGENGAGKTTLIKLLLRFYDPGEGRILVDGVDLREIDIETWRKLITAVFQDFGKYALSIKENIALGEIDDVENTKRFEEAIIKGGAAELVNKLGAEQQLFRDFDGTELSLGEWQRLAISRAFYRNSDIMVLDEPSASLDPKEEAHLFKRFVDLAQGHTVLLVTHRLASVRIAEQILVLKDGQLVEQGSHEDLLAKNKIYAELWHLQAEAYNSA